MKRIVLLLTFIPALVYGRNIKSSATNDSLTQGVAFERGMSWREILAKAKATNKYIFLDCYTTWCGPCKRMENEVYPVDRVGELINEKFIAVKMQMDTSKNDDEMIRGLYRDAHYIMQRYRIKAFPTLLFFTPDGNILSKDEGAVGVDDFIKLGKDILSPERNYYHLLDEYKRGRRDLTEMSFLARTSIDLLGDTVTAGEIEKQYMLSLNAGNWYTKDNIGFMREITKRSVDMGFSFFYAKADSIDKIMDDNNYSQQFIVSIICKEMIFPAAKKDDSSHKAPDWDVIRSAVKDKYNNYYAERAVLAARGTWGLMTKNYPEYTRNLVRYVDQYWPFSKGPLEDLIINNHAWAVFKYSKDTAELNRALSWSNRAIMMNPDANWMDTYANILYKLGQRELAIKWEMVADKISPGNKDIQAALTKMRAGEATWPSQ